MKLPKKIVVALLSLTLTCSVLPSSNSLVGKTNSVATKNGDNTLEISDFILFKGSCYIEATELCHALGYTLTPGVGADTWLVIINGKNINVGHSDYIRCNDKIYFDPYFIKSQLNCNIERSDDKVLVTPLQQLTTTPTVSAVPMGKSFNLNRNGKTLQIKVSKSISKELNTVIKIKLNNISVEDTENYINPVEEFYIIRLSDCTVLAISDKGMSDDYVTYFYNIDGHTPKFLGSVGGLMKGGMYFKTGLTFKPDGSFYSEERLNILCTGWYMMSHKLSASGLQTRTRAYYDMNIATTITHKNGLHFYINPNKASEKVLFKAGTKLRFISTDNKEWLQASIDGSTYWLHLYRDPKENKSTYTQTIDDAGKPDASESFSDLLYAD